MVAKRKGPSTTCHRHFLQRQHGRSQGCDAYALQYRLQCRADGTDLRVQRKDRVLGILPFFHSFGFTGTLIVFPPYSASAWSILSPLDAKVIGALVRQYKVTFLLATPTFLQMYNRSCEPEDFGSLQFVMTGAEKLPDRVAQAFEDKFGIRPLEAYGLTECSPAVTVNTRDFRAAGFRQVGAKRGKIGHPLPAISVRIVDPDTFQPLPVGQARPPADPRPECHERLSRQAREDGGSYDAMAGMSPAISPRSTRTAF